MVLCFIHWCTLIITQKHFVCLENKMLGCNPLKKKLKLFFTNYDNQMTQFKFSSRGVAKVCIDTLMCTDKYSVCYFRKKSAISPEESPSSPHHQKLICLRYCPWSLHVYLLYPNLKASHQIVLKISWTHDIKCNNFIQVLLRP